MVLLHSLIYWNHWNQKKCFCRDNAIKFKTHFLQVLCVDVGYVNDPGFDNKIPTGDFVRSFIARTTIECATRCSEVTDCQSFFYSTSTTTCQQHSGVLSIIKYPGSLDTVSGTKYYTLEGVTTTTVTITTTPGNIIHLPC